MRRSSACHLLPWHKRHLFTAGLTVQLSDSTRPGEVDRQNCPPTLGGKTWPRPGLLCRPGGADMAPRAGVGGQLAGPGDQVQLGAQAGLTCSPPGSWPGSRRPSGWSSPAAGGPAVRWGHSPAAPAASGSTKASKGIRASQGQPLWRQGQKAPSSQTKAPSRALSAKPQGYWLAQLLTKVLRHSTEPTATQRMPVSCSLTSLAQPPPPRVGRGDSARLRVLRPELARPSAGTVRISGPLVCWVLPTS